MAGACWGTPGLAGVVVTQNVSPGATSWPGSPIIQSVTNAAVQATIGESQQSLYRSYAR